ncbi:peptidoglycan DD-metalloendopeptidase family protein [Cylindrospermopsis raciborskii]|uniref:peptidoglycan DD-metalloendopeptidase family protein n=2 Tax=Cylindrospermopsis raciborskii TaxID=77022 RepID=UPI000AD633AF
MVKNNSDSFQFALNETNQKGNCRAIPRAAMIGLAISMGATSLFVTQKSDQAQAAAPVGSEKAAFVGPATAETDVEKITAEKLDVQTPTLASVPENIEVPTEVDNTADDQLREQQEFALNQLKEKSDRLKTNLNSLPQKAQESGSINNNNFPEQKSFTALTTPQVVAPTEISNYQVKPGDTLVEIAGSYGTSVAEIIQANGLSDPHDLQVNQQLIIPQVKSGIGIQVTTATSPVVIPPRRGDQIAISPLVPPDPEANLPNATELPFPSSARNSEGVAVTVPQIPSPSSGSAISIPVAGKNLPQEVTTPKGIGGSTDDFTTTVAIAPKTVPTQLEKVTPNNDRLRSLQAEIERLRQKYRDQRSAITLANSGKVENTPSPFGEGNINPVKVSPGVQPKAVTIAVPRITEDSGVSVNSELGADAIAPNDEPVNPQFVPGSNRRNPSGIRLNIPPSRVNARDSLGKLRGTTVSPSLPPLAAVDIYLPRNTEEDSNSPAFTGHIWPAKGVLTSGYGWRWGRMHRGIDIANGVGTPIYASAPGRVERAGWNNGGYGLLVEIRHEDGSMTRYAHNSRILVRVGQEVQQGETIAAMGSTGFSTGPHTHFEIHPTGKGAVNPIAFLPSQARL